MTENRGQKKAREGMIDLNERMVAMGMNVKQIKSIKDLKVYEKSYQLALDIFDVTKRLPKEETYSLTDQIRRSSRSVAINIREGFAKRKYELVFIRHLTDSYGSSEETRGWLNFSFDFGYIDKDVYARIDHEYDQINAMLFVLINTWQNYNFNAREDKLN